MYQHMKLLTVKHHVLTPLRYYMVSIVTVRPEDRALISPHHPQFVVLVEAEHPWLGKPENAGLVLNICFDRRSVLELLRMRGCPFLSSCPQEKISIAFILLA